MRRPGLNEYRPDPPLRLWTDPVSGMRFRVRLAPMERRSALGVTPMLNALVYETDTGEWVGSAPMYRGINRWELEDDDLAELLEQAIARG